MLFFFILTIIVSLLCKSKYVLHLAHRCTMQVSIIAYIVILFVSLIRFDVGWDYKVYYQAVEQNDIYAIQRFEPLSQLFFSIAFITRTPQIIFILYGVPTYVLILNTIQRYSRNIGFSILLYFPDFSTK